MKKWSEQVPYSVTLFLGLFLFVPRADALYVYLDINNNPYERRAYTEELAREHSYEQFASIPAISDNSALQMISYAKARDAGWKQYVNAGCFAAENCNLPPAGRCSALHDAFTEFEHKIEAVPKTYISADLLEQQLGSLVVPYGENIQLAISGHYSNGAFTGTLGSLSVEDIDKAFTNYPRLRAAVTKLHLLGCNTNTLSQIEGRWRRIFPNARALVGFYPQSPAGDDPANIRFIRLLVRGNTTIDKIRTERQFAAFYSILSKSGLPVALTVDDWYQAHGKRRVRISESKVRASVCARNLNPAYTDEFERVMKGAEPIPTDTSHSYIRDLYTKLLGNLDCLEEPRFKVEQPNVPYPDKVVRLIFYRNVLTNFQRMHRADIVNLNALLQQAGIQATLSIGAFNLYDRRDLQQWVSSVRSALHAMNQESAERLSKLVDNFARVIVDLDPYCIGLDWIEPSGRSKSKCFSVPGECR